MIAYLKGIVLEKTKDALVLLAGDIGYRVGVLPSVLSTYQKGDPLRLHTHLIVRDDAHELVGFLTMDELEFFWRFTGVSGVGPKMAMHLLALGPIEVLRAAVERGDVSFLEGAQGVGRKTAQRVVLELKGKLVSDEDPGAGTGDEVVSALENLGYPRVRVRDIVSALGTEGTTEERIKQALKHLAK